jgi:hypothetical protein
MWATEPFKSYRNHINVYAVEIASIDYGVRRDPDGRVRHPDGTIRDTGEREGPIDTKNTALRLWYSDGLVNPRARGTTYGPAPINCADYAAYYPPGVNPCETGNQAHNRILDNYVAPALGIPRTSQNLQTLASFNSFTYGGIGGTQATTSGGSPQGPLISLHELGHSLGTMADEYPYSARRGSPLLHRWRAGQLPPHDLHLHRADGGRSTQVVAVGRRGEPVRRHARPARGRRHVPLRPASPE